MNDFKEMCEKLGIKCSNSGEFQVQVASQKEVEKFIKKVDPIKSENTNQEIKETLVKS